jgi:hypothetical protein
MQKVMRRPVAGVQRKAAPKQVVLRKRGPASGPSMPSANVDALGIAFARAEESRVELMKSPDMLSGGELGAELGLSRATVDNRRVAGKLLALEFGAKRGFRFPRWQRELVLQGEIRSSFEAVLERLADVGPWSRYRFFLRSAPELDGRTPVEELRAGHADAVLRAAESWAEGEQGGA